MNLGNKTKPLRFLVSFTDNPNHCIKCVFSGIKLTKVSLNSSKSILDKTEKKQITFIVFYRFFTSFITSTLKWIATFNQFYSAIHSFETNGLNNQNHGNYDEVDEDKQ